MLKALNLVALAMPLLLAAPALAQDTFPVAIEHVFGTTTIPAKPERVVTIGWMSQDTVLALGVVPVAIPLQSWGGDENGFLPWVADAIAEIGGTTPVQLDGANGIPFEQILAADPDLILARYSGLEEADYARLSEIAPTVAYADQPWQGEWRDITRTVAKSLGESARGEELIAATEAKIAETRDAHPQFAGKTFVFATVNSGASAVGVYVSTDPRVQLVTDLGFTLAPGAAALPTDAGWYQDVSFERLDTIDADLLIAWHSGQADIDFVRSDAVLSRYRPIAEGNYLPIIDQSVVMATSAPSPLAIPWMLDQVVPQIAATLD